MIVLSVWSVFKEINENSLTGDVQRAQGTRERNQVTFKQACR